MNSSNLNDKGIRSRLVLKWTALEGFKEEGQFSEKSDVVCSVHFYIARIHQEEFSKLESLSYKISFFSFQIEVPKLPLILLAQMDVTFGCSHKGQ